MGDGGEPPEILTWDAFGEGARELAQQVCDSGFEPTVILAIARGGLPVAGAVSYALGLKNCCVINVDSLTPGEDGISRARSR